MFQVAPYFNPYLPAGNTRLDAVLTITSDSEAAAGSLGQGPRIIGFVLDISGSMEGDKLNQAKLATRRGIDMLGEQDMFFVVSFNDEASPVVETCLANSRNKQKAHHSVQALKAGGSTRMSRGLDMARKQVAGSAANAISSVYFLTDGQNDRADADSLGSAIEQCKGAFQCACRGVGTDWKPVELNKISSALLGNSDAVPDPAGLDGDLNSFMAGSMSKAISGATLRLWSPKVVKVGAVKQMSPTILDLAPLARRIDDKTLDIPLGAWGSEARDYQLTFELPAGAIGDEMLACRASVVYQGPEGEAKASSDPIAVTWSLDDTLTTRISKEVAHYTGQTELADSIREGLQAKASGDEDRATRLLGRAAQLADASGNEEVTRRLKKVVDMVDASAGTVRLKKTDKGADMALEMGGARTVRRRSATVVPDSSQP